MARDSPKPKIGAGHASGMFRQGLRELRGALYPESNVAQPTDYGIAGVATPGEVAESRRDDGRDMDEEGKKGPEPPRDGPEME
jgi:hypothetical protein